MNEAKGLWEATLKELSQLLSQVEVMRYFGGSEGLSLDGQTLKIALPEDKDGALLKRNFGTFIQNALLKVSDRPNLGFDFVSTQAELPVGALGSKFPVQGVQGTEEGLLKHFTFDTFVMGPSNQFPLTMAKYVAQHPGDDANRTNPLFLYGPTGVGKTHLLHAIGNMAREHNPKLRVLYTTSENLMNEYMGQWKAGESSNEAIQAFQNKFRTPDILLVDDIQYMTGKSGLQNEFFNIFNALKDAQKQIVMTSDRAPAEIPDLVDRLVSRFQSGLTLDIEVPAYETRLNILRMKLTSYPDVKLSNDVLDFIATRVSSSVRALEGALSVTINYARVKGSDVTVEELEKSLLRTYIQQEEQILRLSCVDVQRAVCSYYNVRMDDLVGQGRSREVAFPRQVAVFLCRKLTFSSTTEIGKAFNRNHTTVLYSCTTVQNLYKDGDTSTVSALKAILATLGQTTSALNS